MARVVTSPRRAAVDPLKHSAPLGGALAFLGIDRCMPLLHGSQGCTAFAKALLTRHFREPIPLQTTALTQVTSVLGGGDSLTAALDTIAARQHPDLIAVLTTGLTEVNGEDVAGTLRTHVLDGPRVVFASTPDFKGGLQDGWSAAVEAIVGLAEPGPTVPTQVNLLTGPALTAADIDTLRDMIEAFGLDVIVAPDLSGSLDGHLADDWSPLTTGGTTLADLRRMGSSSVTIAVGSAVWPAAAALEASCGVPVAAYERLTGLGAVDALVGELIMHSGCPAPASVRRWRARLADGLLDAHFVLGGARVALALEPDLLVAVGSLLAEVGAEIVAAVAPSAAPVLEQLPCAEVVVGDLADLEARADDGGAELVVASSHARGLAARLGLAHLCLGFPVYDRLGAQLRQTAGYQGSLAVLVDAANCVLDHHDTARPAPEVTQDVTFRTDLASHPRPTTPTEEVPC